MYTKVTEQPFHGERDIILAVRDYIKTQGYAPFEMIREWLPSVINLTIDDEYYLENTGMVRINKIIQNLQNHQTLEMLGDNEILSVRAHDTNWQSGFVTRQYATRHHVPILRNNEYTPPTSANSARRRAEMDTTIASELYKQHVELGEPTYDVDAITLRMEVLDVFENDEALSLLCADEIIENIVIRHMA